MEEAPAWLSYASPAMAVLSFMVAVTALIVSVLTYRRAGPRVRVSASVPKDALHPPREDVLLTVVVRNTGLAPVQIVGLSFHYVLVRAELKPEDAYEGPDTPATIQGGHQERWVFDVEQAIFREIDVQDEPLRRLSNLGIFGQIMGVSRRLLSLRLIYLIAVVADLGNGVQVRSRPMLRFTWSILRGLYGYARENKGMGSTETDEHSTLDEDVSGKG